MAEEVFRTFRVDEDEGDVAYAFNQYHLISAPVVDADGRLVGRHHHRRRDDRAGRGARGGHAACSPASATRASTTARSQIVRQRFPWLFVNLMTAILASLVIAQFEAIIQALVALAVLMPIVASMGGNAGTQSLTVAVRALATRDLTGSNGCA